MHFTELDLAQLCIDVAVAVVRRRQYSILTKSEMETCTRVYN